jgi:parallel beta helix pectate lyase-like protein/pectate lyase-like protein
MAQIALFACLFSVVVWSACAYGAEYHVSPAGDDANAGSSDRPWRTIQRAADAVEAGDTVWIAPGTYPEQVSIRVTGTKDKSVTFAGRDEKDLPVIDGSGLRRGRGGLVSVHDSAWVNLRGLRVTHARGRGQSGIFVRSSEHVTVRNCQTFGTNSSGVKLIECRHAVVEGNEIERGCLDGAEENITVKIRCDDVDILNNHIHHCEKEGIDIKEGSRNVRVRGNRIHDVVRQGLYTDSWNLETYNVEFSGNVVYNCGFGIAVCAEQGGLLHDIRIFNNVVYNNAGPGLVVADWGGRQSKHPIENVWFVNNTVVGNGRRWGGGMMFDTREAKNVVVRNNIFAGNHNHQVYVQKEPISRVVDHNLCFGDGEVTGERNVAGEPRFVDAEKGDYRLRAGSPAIDAGSPEAAPKTDYDGRQRPVGKVVDLGAFEYTSGPPATRPAGQ